MTRRHAALIATCLAIALTACGQGRLADSRQPSTPDSAPKSNMESNLDIECRIIASKGEVSFEYTLINTGDTPLHILAGKRMPYLMQLEDGSLLVLQGLHEGDPDEDYFGLEIPGTVTLGPGKSMDVYITLNPPMLTEHYSFEAVPQEIAYPCDIQVIVGIVPEAIEPNALQNHSVESILASQQLVEGPVLTIDP